MDTSQKIQKILRELYGYESRAWMFGLKGIRTLLNKLREPHKKLKTIHIGGTNGKGSVCAFISSILQHSGFKIGVYTSPHLVRFNERIKINDREISDNEVVELYKKIKPHITTQTFFEITSAMAFLYFEQNKVDFAVLEVGLGGRLDATNVVNPLVSIITNISLEHTNYLGNTITDISFEKAGIIKKGVPIITGCEGKSLNVIQRIADKRNSALYYPLQIIRINNKLQIKGYKDIILGLRGDFQYKNASISLRAIELLRDFYNMSISQEAIKRGLSNVRLDGRFQFITDYILIDCAHNPAGIGLLSDEIQKLKFNRLILIIGILKDKDYKTMLRTITRFAEITILTKPNSIRAESPEKLKEFVIGKSVIKYNVRKAIEYALNIHKEGDIILITGSMYLVGEAIPILK